MSNKRTDEEYLKHAAYAYVIPEIQPTLYHTVDLLALN
jgi:hypothetical protein